MLPMQAIANETGINFISVKGPELLNMVGVFALWLQAGSAIGSTLQNVILCVNNAQTKTNSAFETH